MRPPLVYETDRLRMRQPLIDDAEAIFEQYGQDPEVTRYMTWRPHKTKAETEVFLNRCMSVWADGSAYPWVIEKRQDGQLIGMVEVCIDQFKASLGYTLAKSQWGNGYMPEAIGGIVEWLLQQESIYRVWAVCDVDNRASARVLEKVKMQREGVLRKWILHPNLSAEPRDCYCYARIK